jgi:hypothetical protein
MNLFVFKVFQIGCSRINTILELLSPIRGHQTCTTLDNRLIYGNSSIITKSLKTSSHSILHKFSSLNRRVINCLGTVGSSITPCFMLRIKLKCSVVLFRRKSVWIGGGYRLFSRTECGISLWVLLLLNIVLACLGSMVLNLGSLVFESSLLNYLFILRRFCRSKSINLSLPSIGSRIFSLFSSNQVFLTCLLSFLHRALNLAPLPWWNRPLLILCGRVKVLSGELLLINICRHRRESFHFVPLLHKLSDHLSWSIIYWIAVLLVKNYKIILETL